MTVPRHRWPRFTRWTLFVAVAIPPRPDGRHAIVGRGGRWFHGPKDG